MLSSRFLPQPFHRGFLALPQSTFAKGREMGDVAGFPALSREVQEPVPAGDDGVQVALWSWVARTLLLPHDGDTRGKESRAGGFRVPGRAGHVC